MAYARTGERAFNRAVVVMAPQGAEGSPISNFTAAAGKVIWARAVRVNENIQQDDFQGSHGSIFEREEGMINAYKSPSMSIEFYPTPTVIEEMLKSFAGPWVGTQVTWPAGISTWYSLLYAEREDGGGFHAYRLSDAWVRELEISVGNFGVAVARAEIVGQLLEVLPTTTPALVYASAITDDQLFAHRAAEFMYVTGPESWPFKSVTLKMSHGFSHEPYNGEWAKITKQGHMEATGQLVSRMCDQLRTLRGWAENNNREYLRLRLIGTNKELRFNLAAVQWRPTDVGFANRDMIDYVSDFRVGTDNSPARPSVDIYLLDYP